MYQKKNKYGTVICCGSGMDPDPAFETIPDPDSYHGTTMNLNARGQCCGSGSNAYLNPGSGMDKNSGSGSGIIFPRA
jgi:hypothetical protein